MCVCVCVLFVYTLYMYTIFTSSRRKMEAELLQMLWKISHEDIEFTKKEARSMVSEKINPYMRVT